MNKWAPVDLCIAMGDDRTDEMMFRANRDGFNIRVGLGDPTAASYSLADPAEVAMFLAHVCELCGAPVEIGRGTGGK